MNRKISKPKYRLTNADKQSRMKVWTQRDGTEIRIKDMCDTHLCAVIRRVIRLTQEKITEALHNPPAFQGEMAQFHAEAEWEALMSADIDEYAAAFHPLFDDLAAEAERRGLNYTDKWRDI